MAHSVIFTDRNGLAWTVTEIARLRIFGPLSTDRARRVRCLLRFQASGQEWFASDAPPEWQTAATLTRLFETRPADVSNPAAA